MKRCVNKHDRVVLIDAHDKKILIHTDAPTDRIRGVGVLDPATLIGKEYGKQLTIGNKQFWLLPPSLKDKLQGIQRRAQIILPRDIGHILIGCAIEPGKKVFEAGIGSGSLTIALASAVAPSGTVISYDIREEFITHAMKNIRQAGLEQLIITKQQDVTKGIDETNLDAVILDIPTPWKVVEHAWSALKIGGQFCAFSPLISQVEETVHTLEKHPFIEISSQENIHRELVVSTHGTRPSFDMLGHTGYLTFARKVLA